MLEGAARTPILQYEAHENYGDKNERDIFTEHRRSCQCMDFAKMVRKKTLVFVRNDNEND